MGSKANFKQAPVHWPREITKAKLSQVIVLFYSHLFIKQWKKGEKRDIWAILGRFGQVWASWDKLGQVWTRQQISKMGKKGRKNKKREKNLSGN